MHPNNIGLVSKSSRSVLRPENVAKRGRPSASRTSSSGAAAAGGDVGDGDGELNGPLGRVFRSSEFQTKQPRTGTEHRFREWF